MSIWGNYSLCPRGTKKIWHTELLKHLLTFPNHVGCMLWVQSSMQNSVIVKGQPLYLQKKRKVSSSLSYTKEYTITVFTLLKYVILIAGLFPRVSSKGAHGSRRYDRTYPCAVVFTSPLTSRLCSQLQELQELPTSL